MSKNPGEYPDDPLPTPASTPAPDPVSLEEGDTVSSGSSQSAHTAIPSHSSPLPPTPMSNADDFGTPAQRQAAHVTSILHKTPIKPILAASNYAAWSDSVRFGLSAVSFDTFLESDDFEKDDGLDERRHTATKKCIFNWLLASMETNQATRFISMISKFDNGVKLTPFAPALLWKTVRDYYISNSESVKLMLRSEITNACQGPSRDLIEHIEAFRAKVDAYLGANGSMDEEEQARQLVTSLNKEWSEKGCFFLNLGHVTFSRIEMELKKSYQTKKMISGPPSHSSRMTENTEAGMGRRMGRWQTCNRSKCLAQDHPTKPHQPEDCYHNPNNVGKMDDWKRAKQQAGEWVEYPRGSARGRGRGQSLYSSRYLNQSQSSNFPRSEDICSAFRNVRLEERDVSYNVEIHGRFLCSAEPQLACRGDQCSSIGLLDTGASHFMFHKPKLFDAGTMVPNHDPSARLNLAGGGATLDIHSIGKVTMLNSQGEPTTYDECLYVPKLSRKPNSRWTITSSRSNHQTPRRS